MAPLTKRVGSGDGGYNLNEVLPVEAPKKGVEIFGCLTNTGGLSGVGETIRGVGYSEVVVSSRYHVRR